MEGAFIVLEGIDASGKTTQARMLRKRLAKAGLSPLLTAEPSEGPVGKCIRNILRKEKQVPHNSLTLLFTSDRFQHVETVIKPALQQGKFVICDRYLYSTLAYQGGMGIPESYIRELNKFAIKPDLAFFLDVEPELAAQRLARSRQKPQLTDGKEIEEKAFEKYKELVRRGELIEIDGHRDKRAISDDIWRVVSDKLLSREQPHPQHFYATRLPGIVWKATKSRPEYSVG